jgi:hypothetical protein
LVRRFNDEGRPYLPVYNQRRRWVQIVMQIFVHTYSNIIVASHW